MTYKNVAEFKAKLEEKVSKEEAKRAIQVILKYIGENPSREGLLETPERVIKAFDEYFSGYTEDPDEYLDDDELFGQGKYCLVCHK